MAAANHLGIALLTQVDGAIQHYLSTPVTVTQFTTPDSLATVLHWYDTQMAGRGWCTPAAMPSTVQIGVFEHAQSDIFVVGSPNPASVSGGPTTILTAAIHVPDGKGVAAC
jgi:hypothetical protein